MVCAPVALFVYNRPWHTRQTVEALLANAKASKTPLYIFSDAPKDIEASKDVAEVRTYIRSIAGFESVTIIEREANFGLARSIIDGVTRLCEQYGRVIVMEDDLVTSPYFLKFMNEGLERYQDDHRVISIHGYVYPVEQALPENFFLRGADCWGWATWKRGWELFDPDGQKLLNELKRQDLTDRFDFDGSYPYTKMLQNQIVGNNNSWAIRWYASAFLKNKLTLYPGRSLVHNIGADGSGTHCSETKDFYSELAKSPVKVGDIAVEESLIARHIFEEFFKRKRPSLLAIVTNKLIGQLRQIRRNGYGK
jgi:hypothetical protein